MTKAGSAQSDSPKLDNIFKPPKGLVVCEAQTASPLVEPSLVVVTVPLYSEVFRPFGQVTSFPCCDFASGDFKPS